MASNSKHTDWILETIDHLRRRKARPDLERICHVVRRRFGLSASETEAKLEKLVDAEIVYKVDYKGNTSYRNAAKWRKSMLGCAVLNSTTVSIKIIEAILDLSKMKISAAATEEADNESGENQKSSSRKEEISKQATKTGVSLEEINSWLQDNCDGFDNLKSPLIVLMKREIDAGRVKRLMDSNYVITSAQMDEIGDDVVRPLKTNRKSDNKPGTPPAEPNSEATDVNTTDATSPEPKTFTRPTPDQRVTTSGAGQSVPQPARRGRPPKHRPPVASTPSPSAASSSTSSFSPTSSPQSKLKRILTNDSSQSSEGPHRKAPKKKEVKKSPSDEHVCDFCKLTSLSNSKEEPEILLHCKDCTAKAHPSCMKYSSLLASRACRGPWQCMDCKTCCVCQDPGEPDQMLFCDGCDKGYHMSCHQPPITKKPSGSWECSECRLENMKLQRNEFMASIGDRHTLSHDSAPPTPAESPVPSQLINGDFDIPTSPKYLGQDRFPDASGWSVDNVVDYFTSAGFEEQAKTFSEQEIDGVALLLLKRSDVLKGLGIKLGPALKINRLVQGLQTAKQQLL